MKAPLTIMIVIVAGILAFLIVFSQQHEMSAQAPQGHGTAGGYGAAPAAGGYGSTPAAGGYGAAPAAGGYGAPPSGGYGAAPAAGGYGAPPSGGYGK